MGTGENIDGPAPTGQFMQPRGLCTESDHVVMFVLHKLALSNYFLQLGNVTSILKPSATCTMHFQSIARMKDTV